MRNVGVVDVPKIVAGDVRGRGGADGSDTRNGSRAACKRRGNTERRGNVVLRRRTSNRRRRVALSRVMSNGQFLRCRWLLRNLHNRDAALSVVLLAERFVGHA